MPYTQITVPAAELKVGDVFSYGKNGAAIVINSPAITDATQQHFWWEQTVHFACRVQHDDETEQRYVKRWVPFTVWRAS